MYKTKKKKKNRFPGTLQATLPLPSTIPSLTPSSAEHLVQPPFPPNTAPAAHTGLPPPNFPSPAGSLLYLSPSCSRQSLLWGASGHPSQGNRKANSRASPLPLFLWVRSPQALSPALEQNFCCGLHFLSAASPRYRTDLPPHFLTLCPYLLDKTAAYIGGKEFYELHVW